MSAEYDDDGLSFMNDPEPEQDATPDTQEESVADEQEPDESSEPEKAEEKEPEKEPEPEINWEDKAGEYQRQSQGLTNNLRAERQRTAELKRQLEEFQNQRPKADDDEMEYDNPLTKLRAENEAFRKQQEEHAKEQERSQAMQVERETLQSSASALSSSAEKFVSQQPDYYEAETFGMNAYRQQVEQDAAAQGYSLTKEQTDYYVHAGLSQFINDMTTHGIDPARAIYEKAQSFGYKKAEAPEPPRKKTVSLSDMSAASGGSDADDDPDGLGYLFKQQQIISSPF